MKFKRLLALLLTWILLLCCASCSDDTSENGDGDSGTNDAGNDSTIGDANGGGDSQNDTGSSQCTGALPPREEVVVVYRTEPRLSSDEEPSRLWVTDEDCDAFGTCDVTEVTGGSFACDSGCRLSPNLDYAVWIDPATGDLVSAPVDSEYQVSSTSRILSQNVEEWQVGPDTVVYLRAGYVYAQPLAGGDETQLFLINSVEDPRGFPGGFHYAPQVGRVFVTRPTNLTEMNLWSISVSNPTDQVLVYHFGIVQSTSSLYQGQQSMSLSPDGQYLAIMLDEMVGSEPCDPDGAATCPQEYSCFADLGRCVSFQVVLSLINLNDAHMLHTPNSASRCDSDSQCGTYHDCDLSAPDATGQGICSPGRLIIGPFTNICDDAAISVIGNLDAGEYSEILGNPMWRSDGDIVFLATHPCADLNIEVTDLVSTDLSLSPLTGVLVNEGIDHGGEECYDEVEMEYTPDTCPVELGSADISNGGDTIVFTASSVSSDSAREAWIIDAQGCRDKVEMTRELSLRVVEVFVY